jgi:hypothetical protein
MFALGVLLEHMLLLVLVNVFIATLVRGRQYQEQIRVLVVAQECGRL